MDVTNIDEVEAAVRSVKVVINTVCPFWKWGTPVVRCVWGVQTSMWVLEN